MTVESVEEEPDATMRCWGIMQDPLGFRLVGIHVTPRESQSVRVSSPLIEFDVRAMTARTASGRRYHLAGPPDERVAAAVIRMHVRRWGLEASEVALMEPRYVSLTLAPTPAGRSDAN